MGSSGLLCLGIVVWWAFAAVPQWVSRRQRIAEQVEAVRAADASRRMLTPSGRTSLSNGHPATRPSAAPLLAPQRATTPRPVTAPAHMTPARGEPAPRPARRVLVPVVALVATAVGALTPVALAMDGLLLWPVASATAALVTGSAIALRGRSLARRAERDRLAHERTLAAGRARVRAAQVRAAQRRTAAELAAEAAARAAAREAAAFAASRAADLRRRAVG